MYGFPPLHLLVLRIKNNTNTIIDKVFFTYEGINSKDVSISKIKPNENRQTGISTINLRSHTNIIMYNIVNGKRYDYILKENAINPGLLAHYSSDIYIEVNGIKSDGQLDISVSLSDGSE